MGFAITICLLAQFVFSTDLNVRISVAGTHEPVPIARVRVEKLGFRLYEVFARDGRVEFTNLASGRYTIIIDAPGYETWSSEVMLPEDSFTLVDLRPDVPRQTRPQSDVSGQGIRRILHKLFW